MNIIVLGAAGFIGSNLCHFLLENTDHEVTGVDNLSTGDIRSTPVISDRFNFFREDVLNVNALNRIFKITEPDVCYAFQAYAAEGRSNYIRSFIHQNNTVGMANVINACVNYKCKLIFTSSIAVYSGVPPFSEETIPSPIDEYGLSKWVTEQSINMADYQGLDWCIVRPRNVYGERQCLFDPARNLFGILCYNALNNKPLTIFGDGNNKRSFTYIGDIMEPLYNAVKVSKEIINLGSINHYTINEAVDIFASVSGYFDIEHSEPRYEVSEAYCLTEKSERLLGFKDKTDLKTGIEKMWGWAKSQIMQPLQTPPKLEIITKTHSSVV